MKRGVEIQFNWIFIAIIGGIILIISLTIVPRIKNEARQRLISDVQAHLDNMLNSINFDTQSENEFPLVDEDVVFTCNSYKIGDGQELPTHYHSIFSPQVIKTRMYGYSLPFEFPFKTTYLSYITSPEVTYYIKESDKGQILFDMIPQVTKKLITSYSIQQYGGYKVRFITFGTLPSSFPKAPKKLEGNITFVVVEDTDDRFPNTFGRVRYYDLVGTQFKEVGDAYFLDSATFLGSIYSDSNELYKCNLNKALERWSFVLQIKLDKVKELKTHPDLKHCPYEDSIDLLDDTIFKLKEIQDTKQYYKEMFDAANKIRDENIMLERLSCPVIY